MVKSPQKHTASKQFASPKAASRPTGDKHPLKQSIYDLKLVKVDNKVSAEIMASVPRGSQQPVAYANSCGVASNQSFNPLIFDGNVQSPP